MRSDELANMYRLEATYWWFVARRHVVRLLARKHWRGTGGEASAQSNDRGPTIADVGCGTGATLSALASAGQGVGLDISDVALRYCADKGLENLVRAPAEALPLRGKQFDLALCLDVLEHVDDRAAARELHRICRPGGTLIVTAPAYQWLWSEHDEALGHRRRYRGSELRRLLETSGFRVVKMTHVLSLLLLPIALFRLLQRFKRRSEGAPKTALIELPGPLNTALVWLLALEMHVAASVSLPFGVSIVCVAQRPPA